MLRVGICGFGKMGQIRAAAIEAHGGARIVAVHDVVYPEDCPYTRAASIEAIVADPGIDAIVISLPNFLNKDVTIAALRAGKHVLCEKPPCFDAAEMREIIAVEQASDRVLMYGFNHRQHDAVRKMKTLIDSGDYGRVLWMRGRYGKSVDADFYSNWRSDKSLAGGGILIDQGIHMLDLMIHTLGRPFDQVHAFVSNLYWNLGDIEDNVFAIFRESATGVCASFHSTMTQWRHLFSFEVFLERGYMTLNGLKTSSGTYGEEVLTVARNRSSAPAATWEDESRFRYAIDVSWEREIALFFEAIAGRRTADFGSSAGALELMTMIDMIYAHDVHQSATRYTDLIGAGGDSLITTAKGPLDVSGANDATGHAEHDGTLDRMAR